MKQLIEEQKKEFEKKYNTSVLIAYPEYAESHMILLTDIWNWHKQSLKQFIDELIAWNEARITYEDYDVMVCKKCKSVIRRRTSHHSEDGFSECCGSKLERLTGKNKEFTPENDAVEFGIAHLKKLKEELN